MIIRLLVLAASIAYLSFGNPAEKSIRAVSEFNKTIRAELNQRPTPKNWREDEPMTLANSQIGLTIAAYVKPLFNVE